MKYLFRSTLVLLLAQPLNASAGPEHDADFAARCAAPGVVRCIGFESDAEAPVSPPELPDDPAPLGINVGAYVPPQLDTTTSASGSRSLMFTIPTNSHGNTGSYWANFSDDLSVQFGEGSPHGREFYVQWRQRFSREFIETYMYTDYANQKGAQGWKQVIIGEGDRPDANVASCTDLEIVVNDSYQRRFPQMYHSCGAKDGRYEGLVEPYDKYDFLLQNGLRTAPDICLYNDDSGCFRYVFDQWMTFQVHVIVGTAYDNDGIYKHDSTIQLWVAREGEPATLVIDFSPKDPDCQAIQSSTPKCQTGYDLYNDDPTVRHYGQVWLTPFHSRKDPAQPHPEAYTWYDELIVSTQRIADPGVPAPPAPEAPQNVSVQ